MTTKQLEQVHELAAKSARLARIRHDDAQDPSPWDAIVALAAAVEKLADEIEALEGLIQ